MKLEPVDADLVEAIAHRVIDLMGRRSPPADDSLQSLSERHAFETPDVLGEMMTPDEAAPLMRHSAKTVRKLCRLEKDDPRYLRHLRKGPRILIRRCDIADWIVSQIGED